MTIGSGISYIVLRLEVERGASLSQWPKRSKFYQTKSTKLASGCDRPSFNHAAYSQATWYSVSADTDGGC